MTDAEKHRARIYTLVERERKRQLRHVFTLRGRGIT